MLVFKLPSARGLRVPLSSLSFSLSLSSKHGEILGEVWMKSVKQSRLVKRRNCVERLDGNCFASRDLLLVIDKDLLSDLWSIPRSKSALEALFDFSSPFFLGLAVEVRIVDPVSLGVFILVLVREELFNLLCGERAVQGLEVLDKSFLVVRVVSVGVEETIGSVIV